MKAKKIGKQEVMVLSKEWAHQDDSMIPHNLFVSFKSTPMYSGSKLIQVSPYSDLVR